MNNTGESSITINGEAITLYYGLYADQYFTTEWAKDIEEYELITKDGEFTPIGYAYVLYSGYINQCKIERRKPKYGIGDFIKHMDECQVDETLGLELVDSISDWQRSKFSLVSLKALKDKKEATDMDDVKKNT